MNAFRSLFWKEAREHRLVLAVLGALVIVACGTTLVFDVPIARSSVLPGVAAILGVLAVALTIAPNLIPSEAAQGFRFLGRLPVRPRTVFLAKLGFFVSASAVIAALGFGLMLAIQCVRGTSDGLATLKVGDVEMIGLPVVAGLWLMAIACLIPRPLAAIPAAAVAFVIVGGPVWWALRVPEDHRGPQELVRVASLQPSLTAIGVLAAMAVLIPLAATWTALARMLSGRGLSGRTAAWVVGILSCFALPAWGWAGWERWRYENVDPRDADATITDAYVSVDGGRAYLNVQKHGTPSTFVVDLETGRIASRGGPGHAYTTLQSLAGTFLPALATHEAIVHFSNDGLELVECNTGRSRPIAFKSPEKSLPLTPGVSPGLPIEGYRSDLRISSAVRTADGRRAWRIGNRIEAETTDGRIEPVVDLPENRLVVGCDGGSIRYAPRSDGPAADFTPTGALELLGLTWLPAPPKVEERWHCLAVPGGWLFRDGTPAVWKLSKESISEVAELSPNDRPFVAVTTTRVLIRREVRSERKSSSLETFDLTTRKFAPVVGTDGLPVTCDGLWQPLWQGSLRDADGRQAMLVMFGDRMFLTSFDPRSNQLAVAAGEFGGTSSDIVPLRWDSAEWLTVLAHGRRIERLRFGTDEREVLFPRD